MREGPQAREALELLSLLWNHPVLTGLLILVFTPPFFPLVVYFSPLLMYTALCVVALVSIEKFKVGGGPMQRENHLGGDPGVSTWVPTDRPGNASMHSHFDYCDNYLRNLFNNIHIAPVTPMWTGDNVGDATTTRVTVQLHPQPVENNVQAPTAAESDDDWWDKWVKEYESRSGWGEQEGQASTTPEIQTSERSRAPAPAPATTPSPTIIRKESNKGVSSMAPGTPIGRDMCEEECPSAPPAADTVASDAASHSNPMIPREELPSPFQPPPPSPTRPSCNQEEVVEAVKFSDLQAQIFLMPIRTDREKQVDRICVPAQEMYSIPTRVDGERVSAAQALKAINKLLSVEKGGYTPANSLPRNLDSVVNAKTAKLGDSTATEPQVSLRKEAISPQLHEKVSAVAGKGHAVEVSEKNRNKIDFGISTDVAGETPLRQLKASRSEKHSRVSMGYSPIPLRTSRGLKSEKVPTPLHFSPHLLQGSQLLAPKGISPRLPNLTTVPLGNPVDKVPQWVYDGIPKESAGSHVKEAETAEEKNTESFEHGVKVLSHRKRRTHARRPLPIEVDAETLQVRSFDFSTPNTPGSISTESVTPVASLRKKTSKQGSGASSPSRASGTGSLHGAALIAESIAPGVEVSSKKAPVVASPRTASSAASLREATTATSTQQASIMAFPRRVSGAASPQSPSVVASTHEVTFAISSEGVSITASPRQASASSSSRRSSVPSSPSMPHSRRRLHGSKCATDQLTFASSSPRIEVSHCDAQPGAEKKVKVLARAAAEPPEEFTLIEKNALLVDSRIQEDSIVAALSDEEALHSGRNLSPRRSPTGKSRRRLEPRRVVTSEENDMFWKTNSSLRILESSSDDERKSVTPRMSRLIGKTVKPLVWRSRSIENREDSD
ncbi:uncharacterized protein [Physcomitrium patens]|uniref:uncharacterized protein n=1 Tax=Physcomitrium patens TaxID=3218 RepID=UPI000D171C97|nr:uncharacterized protein LOC112279783 [Physcomitrium patens]|eukprot:XP_024370221.1 uncharacterized protein LOC112279783 [Physcomitrella patens]